jgi:hypothetical protein
MTFRPSTSTDVWWLLMVVVVGKKCKKRANYIALTITVTDVSSTLPCLDAPPSIPPKPNRARIHLHYEN